MLTLILFTLLFLLVCILILWLYSSPFYWKRKGVPYLWSWPIFGSCLPPIKMTLTETYHKLYQNYPNEKFFGFHLFTKPVLLLKDPQLIKDIFIKDFDYFSSSGYITNVDYDRTAWNVFFQYGEAWKEIRSKLTNHFTPHKLRNTVQKCVDITVKKLITKINQSIKNKEPLEIDKFLIYLTTDIIVQMVYAVETDCFSRNSLFNEICEKLFSTRTNFKLLTSLIEPKLHSLLKIPIYGKEIWQFFDKLFADILILNKENKLANHEIIKSSIQLLEENKKNIDGKVRYFPDKTRIPEYNEKTINAQLQILVAGGVETTASTMALFLYEVSLNQDIQEKCREEILDITRETDSDIRPEDVQKLKYFRMTINETLRKYPPLVMIPRRCTRRYHIQESDVTIEPNTILLLPIRSIQWDPKFYPEPEKFLPERFSEENKTNIDSATFLAFGIGPKSCLGKTFSYLEISLTLSRLLSRYRFTLSSKTNVPIKFHKYSPIEIPHPGLWVNVEPLKSFEKSDN